LFPLLAAAQTTTPENATLQNHAYETNLSANSTLRLHLHEGDFRIEGTDSEKISIHADGKNIDQSNQIKISLKRSGKTADLTLSNVPKKELVVTIAIPKSTNLYARMRGGDFSVSNITGDKDLELTGGDLTLQVANPDDYSHVDLSVKEGPGGKYHLHAHVVAGNVRLTS
jgi:hypothetical protein